MEITYNSHDFPLHYGNNFQGSNQLEFTVQELMWAAITVGRANFIDVLQHGTYSKYEVLYRASILFANLALDDDTLFKSSAYEHLDPSEKSAVSYFLGLTFTKLLSSKLLNIPWLLHIDVYRAQFERDGHAFRFGSSRIRPDLIGLDNKRAWVVMESKGRTNTMEKTLINHAKNQTRNLRKIGVDYPNLRVAVVTHFNSGRLRVDWADPEKFNEDYFDIKTDLTEYIKNYYKLIFNILSNDKTEEFNGYITHEFSDINIIIGLQRDIFNIYKKNELSKITSSEITIFEKPPKFNNYNFFAGQDGVLIGLGDNWLDTLKNNKKHNQ